mmetsp:Transcript_61579/g.74066  ORF Transcript_61579/g.74066 Transcript_61579/m.74066 type:complete len:345 (+) Transcript_61579:81-1115(+)
MSMTKIRATMNFLMLLIALTSEISIGSALVTPLKSFAFRSAPTTTYQTGYHFDVSSSNLSAKKKKKKKSSGGNQNKQSGFEWAKSFTLAPHEAKEAREIVSSALASFEAITGKPLSAEFIGASMGDFPKLLWKSPIAFVIISEKDSSENVQSSNENEENEKTDTCMSKMTVEYANVAALETVGLKADEFQRFISQYSIENSESKNDIIQIDLPTSMKGNKKYDNKYNKKIIRGGDGDNFADDITISNAQRWSIDKSTFVDGKFATQAVGVAYAWNDWLLGDHTVCAAGGERREYVDEANLEEQVAGQAAYIRKLKEVDGLTNKDPKVADAVEKLLRLKALVDDN